MQKVQPMMNQPQQMPMKPPPGQVLSLGPGTALQPQKLGPGMEVKLTSVEGLHIKRVFNLMQALTGGCARENVYTAQETKNGLVVGPPLFVFRGQSSCCARCCLPPDCRPLQLIVENTFQGMDFGNAMIVDRPCKCTCYCFNRPEMICRIVENGIDLYAGKIIDQYPCYDFIVI